MGIIKANLFHIEGNLVLASAQTIHRRLDRIAPDLFDLIIVDEGHLSAAKTWVKTLSYLTPKLLLSLTATPHREDNMLLGDIYDEIVYNYGIKEGIDNNYLCELDAVRVKTTTSLDKVRTTAGELNQKDLSEEINTPERNQLVVANYLKYAKGRQAFFYCVDIDHAVKLSEVFNEHGIKCKPISGDNKITPNRERDIKDFRERKLEVLTNCMVLTAGVDIPNVSCIGMASPTKSLTKYIQCAGRATRLKDKEHVIKFGQNSIILDYIDNTSRHNLVNAWELDKDKDPEDRVFITREKRDKLLEERKKKALLKIKREEDERVKLLAIPKPKLNTSIRMQEPATEAQLKWISDLGYPVDEINYTKAMCSQIIMDLPATEKQKWLLKHKRYDVDSVTVLTRGMVEAAMRDHEKREKKNATKSKI
jgi:ATP-dependent helicase IRC3